MTAVDHTWSPQQAEALDRCAAWFRDPDAPQIFRLFGYAGTGKTTLARHLVAGLRYPMFAAFTGKAASVLRDRGCPNASTLHSLLYSVSDRDKSKLWELEKALVTLTPGTREYAEAKFEVDQEADRCKRPWFYVNPDSDVRFADILVVDEVSMVDKKLGEDLLSFGKKVLVLGDPAQLPPVSGGGYFTNHKPDILLTEIHRQAADNPILQWATLARRGEMIPYGDRTLAKKFRREGMTEEWLAKSAGQILTGRNDTRRALNARVRKVLARTNPYPVRGDTLVILQNDHRKGVLNGTICFAYNDAVPHGDALYLAIKYPDGAHYRLMHDVKLDKAIFDGKEPAERSSGLLQVDYGYALTVHKAQGSQWDTVTLYDDGFMKSDPDARRRWLYTAITRAAKSLNIVTS